MQFFYDSKARPILLPPLGENIDIVGNPIGKMTLIFTFDGKIEYIILPMLILFLDMWQNTYGWMPGL